MKYSILCIFTQTGHTFTFRDLELVTNNETILMFKYKAMSDGKDKIGTFPKQSICGWSVAPAESLIS